MEKKKKSIVFKKIYVSILSILFVVCTYLQIIPKITQTVYADQYTYGVYTYGYGKASFVTEPFTSAITTRWKYKTTITFGNEKYTSIDLAVSITGLTNYTSILTENCDVTYMNVSSGLVVIRIKCQVSAKIEVYTEAIPLINDVCNTP